MRIESHFDSPLELESFSTSFGTLIGKVIANEQHVHRTANFCTGVRYEVAIPEKTCPKLES
ncbi:hypothetical protein KOR42_37120 [Thalassoglobus neptunius]|uniref:Uncharacterized protein n=1 Tax=Thalassoglobus neptunius TaxID=1938619 RepID=A0A5C5WGX5_9PLAN|nr:hypothetical protein KOR42_37120 [Thalassoglobus neptunius]